MRSCRLVLVLLVLVSMPPRASAAVEGRVWLDANGNSLLDGGEKGVPGCLVSDRTQLVRTDADGRYQFQPNTTPAAVFVVNPSGTWPVGPWWRAAGGAKPSAAADFALKREHQDGPLFFAQGTDIHLRPEAVPLYRKYVAHLNALRVPPRFVVHTGDLVVDALARDAAAAEKLFRLYEDETKAIRLPLRNVPGNHEHVGLARKDITEPGGDYGKGMKRSAGRSGKSNAPLEYYIDVTYRGLRGAP